MELQEKPAWLLRACRYIYERRNRGMLLLYLTDRGIRVAAPSVKRGTRRERLLYETVFPPAFCGYHFYQHPEELTGWLRPHLLDAGIALRRFSFVLDVGQVYLQSLTLPAMTEREQESWLQWEAPRFIPFPAGTFTARLTEVREGQLEVSSGQESMLSFSVSEELRVAEAESIPGMEKTGRRLCLLAAIPRERVVLLQRMAANLSGRLCQITAADSRGTRLDMDFLPRSISFERLKNRVYRGGALALLALSCLAASVSLIQWRLAETELMAARDRLLPLATVREEYRQLREAEALCRRYESFICTAKRNTPDWPQILTVLGAAVPSGCWLEQVQQKREAGNELELRGQALNLAELLQFREALGQTGLFQKILLKESGIFIQGCASSVLREGAAESDPIRFVLLIQETEREK